MTTTRIFRSTDAGAPTLTGQVGSLLSLLRACLVGTAGVAYGSGPGTKLAAGWTEEFTGTNKAAFRNSVAAGGTGYRCRIDDSDARVSLMRWYATMSDVDTGTLPMPVASGTYATGGPIIKSDTADATARPWILWADERTWYLWKQKITSSANRFSTVGGGDFDSFVPSDAYPVLGLWDVSYTATANTGGNLLVTTTAPAPAAGVADSGFMVADTFVPSSTPAEARLAGGPTLGTGSLYFGGAASIMADPSGGSGLRFYFPALVCAQGMFRGRMRGMYLSPNNLLGITDGVTDSGPVGLPAGSVLTLVRHNTGTGNNQGSTGAYAVESVLSW